MEIQEIIGIEEDNKLTGILNKFSEILRKRDEFKLGFNVFSLVSDTYYKENFHSEIIYALLNPKGEHGEGCLFLDLFLDYLINSLGCNLYTNNYKGAQVFNEKGIENQRRIDLLIISSTHAIIIENKIHNAVDMDNQLPAYYKYCRDNNLEVDAVIYLSLDGIKKPDRDKWTAHPEYWEEINSKLRNVASFDIFESNQGLFHWLVECEEKAKNSENKFIIRQYKQLLKSLRGYTMSTNALTDYYELITKSEYQTKLKQIEKLVEMHEGLFRIYPEKLKEELDEFKKVNPCFEECTTYILEEENYAEAKMMRIENSSYFLRVSFRGYKQCLISLNNEDNSWSKDTDFRENEWMRGNFNEDDKEWSWIKNNVYNLTDKAGFNALTQDIKNILGEISLIIKG